MRLVSIASGSSGNCTYIGSENTHFLVDAGISTKRIEQGLHEIGVKGSDLSGIVITHEHSDHIRGLGLLAKRYEIPVYGTEETLLELQGKKCLGGEYPKELLVGIRPDVEFSVGEMDILPFSIDHDAANPVAYRFRHGRKQVAVATDLGHYDSYIIDHLQGLDALLIESNHDVNMLQVGPYPYPLKQRILGERGHLSNEASGQLLCRILHDHIKAIVLSHLSKENNLPELAYETVRAEVTMSELPYKGGDFPLYVAKRSELSEVICV